VILTILAILVLATIGFGVWVFFLKQPHPGVNCHKTTGWVWSPDCKYIEEKFPDKSLADPGHLKLYLAKFSDVTGGGPPVCLPMWYCFRYVNVKTGGYSKFSQWTESPVRAGGDMFPCVGGKGKCDPSLVPQGKKTCAFNQPVIGIPDLQYDPFKVLHDGSFIYTNVHRYVGSPTETKPPGTPEETKTEIIGFLIPSSVKGVKYAWTDVLFNPCKEGQPGCGRCRGC